MNSVIAIRYLKAISPTLNFQPGDIGKIPVVEIENKSSITRRVKQKVFLATQDWNACEISWDFTQFPLLTPDNHQPTLEATHTNTCQNWATMTLEMQRLEEENNRIFINAYGLQDELTPEVPLNEITLTCNPHYRYGIAECEVGSQQWEDLEARLLADTMKEFISYAVGCMFGRYSLDQPGLILANQGEGIEDYWRIVTSGKEVESRKEVESGKWEVGSEAEQLSTHHSPLTTQSGFEPDADNVIPMLDGDWFPDDIAERFRKFLRVTFGEDHYEENLQFLETAIGKDIRKYFLRDFYTDHVKRYKKRPIYWLFSSPKGTFNALIYLHRYRPDTVSVVLNDYLREFRTKLTAHKSHLEQVSISESATATEKTKALKEIEKLNKTIEELADYERDVIYPLAIEQVEIDLDDGVKVNYAKFGKALKKIAGLN